MKLIIFEALAKLEFLCERLTSEGLPAGREPLPGIVEMLRDGLGVNSDFNTLSNVIRNDKQE